MRALISVSDKTGVVEFASGLQSLGWDIIATGGTMKMLQEAGLKVINISEVTGVPEICDRHGLSDAKSSHGRHRFQGNRSLH